VLPKGHDNGANSEDADAHTFASPPILRINLSDVHTLSHTKLGSVPSSILLVKWKQHNFQINIVTFTIFKDQTEIAIYMRVFANRVLI